MVATTSDTMNSFMRFTFRCIVRSGIPMRLVIAAFVGWPRSTATVMRVITRSKVGRSSIVKAVSACA
ncbi:hypothetical protein ASG06_18110 [Rathayibacter sp. Leaf185]|nr:hypothetical protein ASF42_17375 [Rathayibacter sp. Leaf294]KQS07136.1 hypothetical protein ASG06_18110 [Rathayibacter sp. Leaf185]